VGNASTGVFVRCSSLASGHCLWSDSTRPSNALRWFANSSIDSLNARSDGVGTPASRIALRSGGGVRSAGSMNAVLSVSSLLSTLVLAATRPYIHPMYPHRTFARRFLSLPYDAFQSVIGRHQLVDTILRLVALVVLQKDVVLNKLIEIYQ
jgi:hypothetical protein